MSTGTPKRFRRIWRDPTSSRWSEAASRVVRSGWVIVCDASSQPAAIIFFASASGRSEPDAFRFRTPFHPRCCSSGKAATY